MLFQFLLFFPLFNSICLIRRLIKSEFNAIFSSRRSRILAPIHCDVSIGGRSIRLPIAHRVKFEPNHPRISIDFRYLRKCSEYPHLHSSVASNESVFLLFLDLIDQQSLRSLCRSAHSLSVQRMANRSFEHKFDSL